MIFNLVLKIFSKILSKWKVFVYLFFIFIIYCTRSLYRQVSYQQVDPLGDQSTIYFSLDFCYDLSIRNESFCSPSYNIEIEKQDFPENCSFELPIECYTKNFNEKPVGEILAKFSNCKIENLVKIDRLTSVEYKIYFGHICVKNKFEINFTNGSQKVNIIPQQKNQLFSITISSHRVYENEKIIFYSPIVNIFRRFCWMEPFPPRSNETTVYHCSEDGRDIKFKLDYFSVKSLPYPYTTNCIQRNGTERTRTKCYENCVKKEKSHFFMTYRDVKDTSKLIFDNATVMEPLVNKCLNECKQPDCNYGSFDVGNIINRKGSKNGSLSLEIESTDHRTEVIPMIHETILIYCLSIFVYLFFGFNLYEHLIKKFCLKSFFDHLNRKKQLKQSLCQSIVLSLVTLMIGLTLGTLCEWKLFNFGRENQTVVIKKESTFEMNVSLSVCFELNKILKETNQNLTREMLFTKTLDELNELTWTVKDFKMRSSMRDSVGALPIRHDEKEILIFYRNFSKCFLIYQETKQLFPHIYLQRKSHIFFNNSNFDHFYVEHNLKYPQIESEQFIASSLFTLRMYDFKSKKCKRYTEQTDGCRNKDDCIQSCILNRYLASEKSLPIFINLKENEFDKNKNLKFSSNAELYVEYLEECKSVHPIIECDSVNITKRPKFIVKDDHNISINLTPNLIVYKELDNEDSLVVFNRIIGILILLTGFSVRDLINDLITIFQSSFSSIMNYRLIKRIANLIVFLFFSVHFVFLYRHIINHEMQQISYKNFLDTISLPKLRICVETGIDLSFNNWTKKELDKVTLSMEDFFIGLNYLDDDFNTVFRKINDTDTKLIAKQSFYLDNMKCFSISIKKSTSVANVNILLIDQLVTIFVNLTKLNKRRFLVYLNVENTIDLEWSTFLHNGTFYNMYFSTKEHTYSDDYYYLKNIKNPLLRLFNLTEEVNNQKSYFHYLRKNYNDEQYVTTTIVPLKDDKNLMIKNDQFNAFIHFRSIDGTKNNWDFVHNSEIFRFSYDLYKEPPERRNESVANKSIVALRPNLSCLKNKVKNRYHFIEFCLHLFILTAFWLKVNLVRLPESLKKAYPVFKFFITLVLYIIVVILIFIFDLSFKFFSFFK